MTVDPVTGATGMTGADALPWALDTLDLGGDIRGRYIRLQDWARQMLAVAKADPKIPKGAR